MPRYYFNSLDSTHVRDEEGTDLPDIASAKVNAARLLADLVSDNPNLLGAAHTYAVEATDDEGAVLFTAAVVTLDRRPSSG